MYTKTNTDKDCGWHCENLCCHVCDLHCSHRWSKVATLIGHVNEYPTMHYFENQRHTHSNNSIYDFDWVFLEIPVKNFIMRILLTCPIKMNLYQSFDSSKNQLSHANETRVYLKNSYAVGRGTTKKKPLSICRMIYLQPPSLLNLYCFLAGPVYYIGVDKSMSIPKCMISEFPETPSQW